MFCFSDKIQTFGSAINYLNNTFNFDNCHAPI